MTTVEEKYDALTEQWKKVKARKDIAETELKKVEQELEALDREIDELSDSVEAAYQRRMNS